MRRWAGSVFTMEIRKLFSYRADFWIHFLGSLVAQFGVAWFLWKAVFEFRAVDRIGPYTFHGMMLYYILAPLVARSVHGADMGNLAQEIYDGTLNRYLLYPVSVFRFKLAASAAQTVLFLGQLILALAVFAWWVGIPPEFHITAGSAAAAVVSILAAAYLHYVVVATIELAAFWADNVWSLVIIVRFLMGLLGGGMLPLALFPDWAQPILYGLPFSYFIAVPVETFLGQMSPGRWLTGMGVLVAWSVVFSALFRVLWNRGRYAYTGVGI